MGCVNSVDEKNLDTTDKNAVDNRSKQTQQRRRLSVDPKHVNSGVKDPADEGKNGAKPNGTEMTKPKEDKDDSIPAEGVDLSAFSAVEQESASKLVAYAVESRKGVVPYNRNKVNQDRALCKFALQNAADMSLFGVMDGHGEFGHFVAGFVQDKLPPNLIAQAMLRTNPTAAILAATDVTCKQLAKSGINCTFSGTTCVFGVRIEDRLFVANIGDSRCVMCRQSTESPSGFQCIALSLDQKPDVKGEKERILQHGGRVEPLPGPPGEDCGPPRVWLPEVDVPGLAMSRSIGDEISQRVGVISVPEIIEHKVQSNDIFAIWASDGVWEFLSNEQACEIVWNRRDNLKAAAKELTIRAADKWKEEEEVIDDITCVIIQFNPSK